MARTKIVASVHKKSDDEHAIIGYFEGKSGDGTVINENGLKIGTEVWENIFNSDEYKSHLKNGFYIGFLGHPEEPGCQDFKNACIVLREAHIDDNGEVFARCDLVNTPVGKIVKTFIDAGVHFGLSVRGAGNIISSEVDPDDFIFRGFDVVAFPAYTDAIPKFVEIAASTNLEDKVKYKKICASVCAEVPNISSISTLKEIQNQFGEDSDPYKQITDRMIQIGNEPYDHEMCDKMCDESFLKCKFEGIMSLYLKSLETIKDLTAQLEEIQLMLTEKNRRLEASTKIYNSQMKVMASKVDDYRNDKHDLFTKYREAIQANKDLKKKNSILASTNTKLDRELKSVNNKLRKSIRASEELKAKNESILAEKDQIAKDLEKAQNINLNYKYKVNSSNDAITERDSIISSLETQLNETVSKADISMRKLSNCGNEITELKSDVDAALDLVAEYQNAYAELYASIVGVDANGIVIANTTTVRELQDCIMSSTSTANISVNPDFLDYTEDELDDEYQEDEYFDDYSEYDEN